MHKFKSASIGNFVLYIVFFVKKAVRTRPLCLKDAVNSWNSVSFRTSVLQVLYLGCLKTRYAVDNTI
jgi:hypothetical protein